MWQKFISTPHHTLGIHFPTQKEGTKKTKLHVSFRDKIKKIFILYLHLKEPRKLQICQFTNQWKELFLWLVCFFVLWFIQHWSGTKSTTGKMQRLLTYIIWEDISSCFDSNNVWVVIEDFECYRTVIFVCKRHKLTTTTITAKFQSLIFNKHRSLNLPSAFLWKFSFTSSLACRGYKRRMEC